MSFEVIKMLKQTAHSEKFTIYEPTFNETTMLTIIHDELVPAVATVQTISHDSDRNEINTFVFEEIWPDANSSLLIKARTLIRDAWLIWAHDLIHSTTQTSFFDVPFITKVMLDYLNLVQQKEML